MTETQPSYNGPGKDAYFETVGHHLSLRYEQMRAMARQAKNIAAWERRGGIGDDIRDGVKLAKLSPEERSAEAQRRNRVNGWHGIIQEEGGGQWSFADALEKPPEEVGAGGYPLGSAPSVALARIDGYRSGKDNHLSLADSPWEEGTHEREAWDVAFGQGMEDRPPPKPEKEVRPHIESAAEEAPRRGRGRPRKVLALAPPENEDDDLPDMPAAVH